MPAVSVIVPVYNPGSSIDDCIRTLLGQSLPAAKYEVIFVDDGSTDGTGERLDALAADHAHVRVRHIPNSGWPGRPRNIGIEMARGTYVYFVDNDDWITHEALERLLRRARRDRADVVVGKVVGHGKGVAPQLFDRNHSGLTIAHPPLLKLLSPHKLFRRAFLDAHGIRFPEGRRRLEDHLFVVHAYAHTKRISIMADHPCYHWVSREDRTNASLQRLDPAGYYGNVREVLDLVTDHVEPGPLRERLLVHWYHGKMLRRMGGGSFARREEPFNRELVDAVRALAVERFPRSCERLLPYAMRIRAALLRDGTYDDLLELARFEGQLRARSEATLHSGRRGTLEVRVKARLEGRDEPLRFAPDGAWLPPASLEGRISDDLLPDAAAAIADSELHVTIRSPIDKTEYLVGLAVTPGIDDDGTLTLVGEGRIDGRRAAAGARLPAGDWELHALVMPAGFRDERPVRRAGRKGRVVVHVDDKGRISDQRAPAPRRRSLRWRIGRRVARLGPALARR